MTPHIIQELGETLRVLFVIGGPALWAVIAYCLFDLYRMARRAK